MNAARFIVSGRVQGVFFRASTRDQAQQLRLSGQARNLADGRVEVLVWGSSQALDVLEQWLQVGPAPARVDAVSREPLDAPVQPGFAIA